MLLDLTAIRGVVMDIDGVLWRGSEVLPGAPEFIAFLRRRAIPFVLASNNSTRTIADYLTICANFNLAVDADQIVSSPLVTVDELRRSYPPGTPIYVLGAQSLADLLVSSGFVIDPSTAKALIVGLDTSLTYEKLTIALRCLLNGAEFIGTNADATLPIADGMAPGAGSMIAALERASGRTARLMGKPQPAMFQVALRRIGSLPAQSLMIGDRLDTDIDGAQQVRMRTALVLCGVATRADLLLPNTIQPDAVFEDLRDLLNRWSHQ